MDQPLLVLPRLSAINSQAVKHYDFCMPCWAILSGKKQSPGELNLQFKKLSNSACCFGMKSYLVYCTNRLSRWMHHFGGEYINICPRKTNIAPEKWWLEDYHVPFEMVPEKRDLCEFSGVILALLVASESFAGFKPGSVGHPWWDWVLSRNDLFCSGGVFRQQDVKDDPMIIIQWDVSFEEQDHKWIWDESPLISSVIYSVYLSDNEQQS